MQTDTNDDEPRAKRLKLEDEVATAVLQQPSAPLQTAVKVPQATPLDDQIATSSEQEHVPNAMHSSPTSKRSDSPRLVKFDPRGDVELRVKSSREDLEIHTVFYVCSRTLARVSAVWESFLFSAESEGSSPLCHRTVFLDLKKTRAMEIILHILHHNTSKIPALLGTSDLKYFLCVGRMIGVMSPLSMWGTKWFNSIPPWSESRNGIAGVLLYRMWFANDLGLTDKFHESMRDIASKLRLDSNGNLAFHLPLIGGTQRINASCLKDEQCLGTSMLFKLVKLSRPEGQGISLT